MRFHFNRPIPYLYTVARHSIFSHTQLPTSIYTYSWVYGNRLIDFITITNIEIMLRDLGVHNVKEPAHTNYET